MNGDRSPQREAWPLSATVITSLAVSATVGLAMVVYVFAVAGGSVHGRLVALLPIFFFAAFATAIIVFWAAYFIVARIAREFGGGQIGAREHGIAVLLTFLAVSALHYMQGVGMRQLLHERESPSVQAGSCPERTECLPLRPADELTGADARERMLMAERGRLSAATFALLMRDADPRVRATLARRADLPVELLDRMAGDRAAEVREAVAESPRAGDDAMNRLAFDPEESVRLALARNRNAPPTALDALAGSPSSAIRDLVAAHPNASEPVLRRLLNGSSDPAEQMAKERLRAGKVRG